MNKIAVYKVKNLKRKVKEVVQELLGQELAEEDQVTVMVFPPHPAPPARVRKKAFSRLEKILDKAARNMKDTPAEEFDAAVDEAMKNIRRRTK